MEQSEKRRNKSWITRHKKGLSFLSSIVVLLTFVFKEALRENAKDFTETIEKARAKYESRKNLSENSEMLKEIRAGVLRLNQNSTPDEKDVLTIVKIHNSEGELSRATQENLISANVIAKELPDGGRLSSQLANIAGKLFDAEDVAGKAGSEAQMLEVNIAFKPLTDEERSKIIDLEKKEKQAILDARVDRDVAESLIAEVLRQADNAVEERSRRYTKYTIVSYVLFFLAWSLGLFIPHRDD